MLKSGFPCFLAGTGMLFFSAYDMSLDLLFESHSLQGAMTLMSATRSTCVQQLAKLCKSMSPLITYSVTWICHMDMTHGALEHAI